MSKSIGILIKARKYLPKDCLRTLYHTFVYPYLTYCIHVWGNTYSTYLDPIIKAQKRIVRIITHSPYNEHTSPLFTQLKILNLEGIYRFMISTFMYKFHARDLPVIFMEMFRFNKNVHNYVTRKAGDCRVPNWNLEIKKRSVSVQGGITWNKIPDNIKLSVSLEVFKDSMKKHLLNSADI